MLLSASFAGNDDFGPEAGEAFRAAFDRRFAAEASDGTAKTTDPEGSGESASDAAANRTSPLPSVRELEVRGCGFGAECEEALEAAVRASRARLEARVAQFPDRASGTITNATFFENLREERR